MNDQTTQMMNQHQMMNQLQNQSQMAAASQAQMVNQLNQQPLMVVSQAPNPMIPQSKMNYGGQWPQPPPNMPPPNMNAMKFPNPMNQMYGGVVKPAGRGNWKGKKPMDKRKDFRRKDKAMPGGGGGGVGGGGGGVGVGVGGSGLVSGPGGYQPPTLFELEQQNRLRARRFYHPKKKFNRMGPYAHAPRNTTSYIIRAKKSGGIASLVSPCPVTPAVLPTPKFSPSREALVDMAKEEWGVDGYGSMKGLIRLRSPGHDETVDEYDEEDEGGSSESDVEEHVEVERRLDHDLSRFEMIHPNSGVDFHNVLENRVDDQDTHIAQLEEENLILKERLYLMERELGELRRRLLCLERQNQVVEDINEEVVENVSENDSEGLGNHLLGDKHNEEVDYVPRNGAGRDDTDEMLHNELRELAVKDAFHGEGVETERNDVVLEDNQHDRANEELVFEGDNKGEKLGEGQVQEQCVGQKESLESEDTKDMGLAVGTDVKDADEVVRGQPVSDVCMGEAAKKVGKEGDRAEGVVEEATHDEGIVAGAQVECNNEESNKEAAGDVVMGDALQMDKGVNNEQPDQ